ncbi:hypothetical protein EXIGLDRAFT_828353 [Exidia glandulosa HHB12029]|uniref:Uncharacterized protein n=1 Tax=Exidia glandulosa HHB12029 TaxID=1314781 RepID=A0A166BRF2_EXIGL|nr:hypothetical protein EXIGLDRAFT_828353 [Exidia glandulosa HHB12029]
MPSHDNSEWEDFDALLEAALPSESHKKEVHEQTDAEMAAELEAALSSAQEDETSSLTEEELEFAKELEDALNEDDTINDTRVISHKSSGHIQTPIRDTSGGKKGNGKGNDRTAVTSPKTQTSSAATAELVVVESQRASPCEEEEPKHPKKSPARKTPTRKQGLSKKASSRAQQVTAPEQPTIIERTSSAAVNAKPLLALPGTAPAVAVDKNEAPRAIRPLPRPHIGRTTKSDAKASASGSTSLEQLHATESDSVHAPPSYRPARSKNAPKSSAGRKRRSRAAPPPPPELPPQKETKSDMTPTMTPLPDWMLDSSKPWGTGLPKGPYRVRVEAPARSASAPQLEAAQGSRPVVGDRHHSAPVPSTSGKRARGDDEEGDWEDIGDDCMMLVPKRAKLADLEPRKDAQPGSSSSTVLRVPSYPSFPTAPGHPPSATPTAPEALTAGGRVARTSVGNAAPSLSGGMQHARARQALPVQSNQLHGRATHTGMHPDVPPSAVPGLQFAMPRYILGQESSARAPGPNVIPYGQALQDTRVAQLPFNTTAPRNATLMPGPVEGLPRPILRHPAPNAQRQRLPEAIEQLRNPDQQSDEPSQMSISAPPGSTEQLLVRASAPAIRDPFAQYRAYAARQEQQNPWPSMQMLPGSAETWQGPGRAPQMQMDDSAVRFPPPQLHGMGASYEENMRPSGMNHFYAEMPVPKATRNGG